MSDYVLPELVAEILKRLPVKSLLRFRCVCRDWCSLISSPNFSAQHLSHSSSSPSTRTLVRYYYNGLDSKENYKVFDGDCFNLQKRTEISFPFRGISRFFFRIVGSCNGLLYLSDDLFGYKDKIIIWNPSIKRAITLPTLKFDFNRLFGRYIFALGFGFDSESNDYKVVKVSYFLPDNKHRHVPPPVIQVFSISSGVWRRLKNMMESYITEKIWSQAVIRGAVHWVASKSTSKNKDKKPFRNLILRFDLHNEKFDEMGLPEELAIVPPVTVSAIIVKGQLSIFHTGNNLGAIWVMKEYGNVESWTKIFDISLENTDLWRMLYVKKDGEFVFSTRSGELVSFNLENMEDTKLICGGDRCSKESFYVDKYEESLVLLGEGKEVRGW